MWGDQWQFRVCGGFCCPADLLRGRGGGRGRALGPCVPRVRLQGPLPEPLRVTETREQGLGGFLQGAGMVQILCQLDSR